MMTIIETPTDRMLLSQEPIDEHSQGEFGYRFGYIQFFENQNDDYEIAPDCLTVVHDNTSGEGADMFHLTVAEAERMAKALLNWAEKKKGGNDGTKRKKD